MTLLSPLVLPFFLGFFFLSFLLNRSKLPHKTMFITIAAPAAGLISISMLESWLYVIPGFRHEHAVILFVYASIVIFIIANAFLFGRGVLPVFQTQKPGHDPETGRLKIFTTGLSICVFLFFLYRAADFFWGQASLNPHGGWGGRPLWEIKALFLYRDPGHWETLLNPKVGWNNQDYPLMLPHIINWGWIWLDR